jgi:hypothetical protein
MHKLEPGFVMSSNVPPMVLQVLHDRFQKFPVKGLICYSNLSNQYEPYSIRANFYERSYRKIQQDATVYPISMNRTVFEQISTNVHIEKFNKMQQCNQSV